MKPWFELSDIEKRITIANRIGYKITGPDVEAALSPTPGYIEPTIEKFVNKLFPNWLEDDGIAFAQVLPKICELPDIRYVHVCYTPQNGPDVRIFLVHGGQERGWSSHPVKSATWSRAICEAAYCLIPDDNPNVQE